MQCEQKICVDLKISTPFLVGLTSPQRPATRTCTWKADMWQTPVRHARTIDSLAGHHLAESRLRRILSTRTTEVKSARKERWKSKIHGSSGLCRDRSEREKNVCCDLKSGKRDKSECERGECWRDHVERSTVVTGLKDSKRDVEDVRVWELSKESW